MIEHEPIADALEKIGKTAEEIADLLRELWGAEVVPEPELAAQDAAGGPPEGGWQLGDVVKVNGGFQEYQITCPTSDATGQWYMRGIGKDSCVGLLYDSDHLAFIRRPPLVKGQTVRIVEGHVGVVWSIREDGCVEVGAGDVQFGWYYRSKLTVLTLPEEEVCS